MPIRLTGINSGMDTESIITELVKAKSAKKDKLVKAQTKLEWKQEAWKELNSKVYGLYTKTLSNLRLEGDYSKKVTKLSDESVANIVTGGNAVDGVQELKISKLAKSGYLTGGKIEREDKKGNVTANTTLKELGITGDDLSFNVEIGPEGSPRETKEIKVTERTTVSELVTQLKDAGLNVNFDEKNQRFFISSKESGEAANFELKSGNGDVLSKLGLDYEKYENMTSDELANVESDKIPHKIDGTDAEILLNGATFKSNTNTFEINGLTITANKVTDAPVTLTTTQDTDGIYDMIKNFLKEYNTIINELDSLYNAESSKGYEPLTEEEKEAMSEKEVEKWEEKIKKSILRKDDTVNKVASAMKSIMLQGVMVGATEVDGKMVGGTQMYLSDFGINTLGYFTAAENEKNAYHIDGDPDNTNTANKEDKLKAMIASEPDTVIDFFSNLTKNLYNKIGDMMKKTDYSSSFTLYDDVLMKKDYDDYKKQIADQEKKITAFEDRYYDKFAAMETALSKLQSKESAIAGLLNY